MDKTLHSPTMDGDRDMGIWALARVVSILASLLFWVAVFYASSWLFRR